MIRGVIVKVVRPNRVKRSYTQFLAAPPAGVFPVLCPVREEEWVPGWEPELVISGSGVAEEDCMFVTPADPAAAIWIVTRYDRAAHELTMYKVTPGHTVGRLDVALDSDGKGGTEAEVSYEYTSLGPAGDAFLDDFTEEWYRGFMQGWELALNHYLETGEKIP